MAKTIQHKNNLPYFGDAALLEIASTRKFSDMIFELLSEKVPNLHESKLFETILNISIDHGEETPSAVEVIKNAHEGKTISESVAAGILQINEVHGGAIEPAMELFYKIKNDNLSVEGVVKEYIKDGKRMPGFGHRIYEVDPRSQLLFDLAKNEGLPLDFVDLAIQIEKELKIQKGKALPANIDGSIAAILCAFGWDSKLGKAVFLTARTPGLCGQFLNNKS